MLMTSVLVSGGGAIMNDTAIGKLYFVGHHCIAFFHDIPLHSSQFSRKLRWQDLPTCSSLNPGILWLLLCLTRCSGGSCSCCIGCREPCCSAQTCCRQLLSCERGVGVTEVPAWKIRTLLPTITSHVSTCTGTTTNVRRILPKKGEPSTTNTSQCDKNQQKLFKTHCLLQFRM